MKHGAWFLACLCFFPLTAAQATTRISLGYGMQLNSMLNAAIDANVQRLVLNSGNAPVVGQSAGTDYRSNWSASADGGVGPYPLLSLPEIRLASTIVGKNSEYGVYTSLTGIVPMTAGYYLGNMQLKESRTCSGVDYGNCPLAAVNFVSSAGTAMYDTEVRTNLRSFNISGGFIYARKVGNRWGGDLVLQGEFGVNIQSIAATTQFSGLRCTTGAAAPCAQAAQSRALQGELKTQSDYALGPQIGLTLRFERPQAFWFAEIGATTTVLFSRFTNAGYTNFVAGGTVAFTQSSTTLGIDAVQQNFAVLPAIVFRLGVNL